jgi:aspartate aminotransferase-like enzyme
MVSEVYALNEATDELLEEGLENSFKRHRMVAEACRDGAERAGFQLWPKRRKDAANTVTALQIPSGTTDTEIVTHMVEKYGILIGGGYKETKGELLRIGHMGYQATLTNIMTTLEALERTLAELRQKKPIAVPAM